MKYIFKNGILGLAIIVWLSGCSAETSTENSAESNTESRSESSSDTKITKTLAAQNACDALSSESIAQVLQWSGEITSESMTHKEGKRSLCRFNHGDSSLWLRLGWKSEKAASNKVLEKQFEAYLTEGEDGIAYESVTDNIVIFGVKTNGAAQQTLYVYRKRFGNDAELMFELNSASITKENALDGLKKLANNL